MRFHHAPVIYGQLPMKNKGTLPDEGFGPRVIRVGISNSGQVVRMTVRCLPKSGKSSHRVLVHCGVCGKDIPFGRMNQHYGPCNAKAMK